MSEYSKFQRQWDARLRSQFSPFNLMEVIMKKILLVDSKADDGTIEKQILVSDDYLADIMEPDTISAGFYNFLIGSFLIYGFLINVFECSALSVIPMPKLPAFLGPLLYILCAFIGSFFIREKAGTFSVFIGYHFCVVPVGVSVWLGTSGRYMGDVLEAVGITTAITFMMLLAYSLLPRLFAGLGKFLMMALFSFVICELLSIFVLGSFPKIFNITAVFLFSLYIGYDWYMGTVRRKCIANALRTALELYLDIINIFLAFLRSKR